MPDVHATLSASGAHRWLNCPPSALLEADLSSTAGAAAAEGTQAHAMAEAKLRAALDGHDAPQRSDAVEMEEHTDAYVALVLSIAQELASAQVMVEQRVSFDHIVPQGFGTADAVVLSEDVLHIVDLKYGVGVLVDAHHNPQLMLYALGALEQFGCLYDFNKIRMTIFQPRRDHVSTFEMWREELEDWGNTVAKPTAQMAFAGQGQFKAGDWCMFCKARATCRARAEENLRLLRKEFAPAPTLDEAEIADVVAQASRLSAWAKDVENYAKTRLLAGEDLPGLKLVAGRGRRAFTDHAQAAAVAQEAGFEAFDAKPKTLTALEKAMGKKTFTDLLGGFVTKTEGEPQLVPASDPRPQWASTSPQEDFKKEN